MQEEEQMPCGVRVLRLGRWDQHICVNQLELDILMGFSTTTIDSMGTKLMADDEGVSSSGFPFSL